MLGLPTKWNTFIFWLFSSLSCGPTVTPPTSKKNSTFPKILLLKDYSVPAPEAFWNSFPHYDIPENPETGININALAGLIQENRRNLLTSEVKRTTKCLDYLVLGAPEF
jgi:hypothetical protein